MKTNRSNALNLEQAEFKKMGYQLVDDLSDLLSQMSERPVTTGKEPFEALQLIGEKSLPDEGKPAPELLKGATELLIKHSLFNGHPKFLGYITSSPSPLGILADLLASGVNQNTGAQILSPVATEIEKQTVSWLSEFIGLPDSFGGLLVSGGNMANFTAYLAGRTAKAGEQLKEKGLVGSEKRMMVYCSKATHTWIEKAVTLFGQGLESIRWIACDDENKIDVGQLKAKIQQDLQAGHQPFMVVGTAGDVSTGTVDNLNQLADCCELYKLWFHIDGAYGSPAAILPELKPLFSGMERADSIALDPHKWLYNPLEAGCTLVKDPKTLTNTFSSNPEYYNFSKNDDEQLINFYEYGLQNSRGFRALKVWLTLQQAGKKGYIDSIREDIDLAKYLFNLADNHTHLQAVSRNLSITCIQFKPNELDSRLHDTISFVNELNEKLLDQLQNEGEVFLSNAIINGNYCLRACVVNFRTSKNDIEEIVEIIVARGESLYSDLLNDIKSD